MYSLGSPRDLGSPGYQDPDDWKDENNNRATEPTENSHGFVYVILAFTILFLLIFIDIITKGRVSDFLF